jgi:AcrR family transcriptional regulator
VSPARARTSREAILAASRELLESGGLDAVTMVAVARRIGIRPPSLYKWFPDRGALVAAIAASASDELGRRLAAVSDEVDAASGIRSMAVAYRSFAHAHPRAYGLLFMDLPTGSQLSAEDSARASAPLLALTRRLAGQEHGLEAARLVTAFAHGFVSMELNGAFRLGGDVDAAFGFGVDVLVGALASRARGDDPAARKKR